VTTDVSGTTGVHVATTSSRVAGRFSIVIPDFETRISQRLAATGRAAAGARARTGALAIAPKPQPPPQLRLTARRARSQWHAAEHGDLAAALRRSSSFATSFAIFLSVMAWGWFDERGDTVLFGETAIEISMQPVVERRAGDREAHVGRDDHEVVRRAVGGDVASATNLAQRVARRSDRLDSDAEIRIGRRLEERDVERDSSCRRARAS